MAFATERAITGDKRRLLIHHQQRKFELLIPDRAAKRR